MALQFRSNRRMRCVHGQLTAAQVNAASRAGTVIVKPEPGRTITVWDGWLRADGATSGCTAVILTDTASSPVTAWSMAAGGLTAANVARVGLATHSTHADVGTPLTGGKGLRIGCTVGDFATSTVLDYCIFYTVES